MSSQQHQLEDAIHHHQNQTLHLAPYFFLSFHQMVFWAIFMLPAQGFVNSLIYFYSPMKQPRKSFVRSSLSRKRSSATNVPEAPAFQDKEFQELSEEVSIEQESNTNATTEGSPEEYLKVEDLVTMVPDANIEQ
jgi:hypothetical protein